MVNIYLLCRILFIIGMIDDQTASFPYFELSIITLEWSISICEVFHAWLVLGPPIELRWAHYIYSGFLPFEYFWCEMYFKVSGIKPFLIKFAANRWRWSQHAIAHIKRLRRTIFFSISLHFDKRHWYKKKSFVSNL